METWTDVENIAAGENWQSKIEEGLLQARVLLYVASRNTSTSEWVNQELRAFMRGPGRIIPLIIDDDGPAAIPEPLQQFQWADFRSEFDDAFYSLLTALHEVQGAESLAKARFISRGYVFISYAYQDASFVEKLKLHLKKRGYAYWDFRESERNYQVDYTLELEGVIQNAEATLSVISPNWKKSPTSMQEMHFSKEVGTPVFLLRLSDPGPTLSLAGLTCIEFTGSHANGFEKLDSKMKSFGL